MTSGSAVPAEHLAKMADAYQNLQPPPPKTFGMEPASSSSTVDLAAAPAGPAVIISSDQSSEEEEGEPRWERFVADEPGAQSEVAPEPIEPTSEVPEAYFINVKMGKGGNIRPYCWLCHAFCDNDVHLPSPS